MKKQNDGLKMLKYFKNHKTSLVIYSTLLLIYCGISIVSPIVNAHLLTSLTSFDVSKAIAFALLVIGIDIFRFISSYATNVIYIKHIKQKVILNIRKAMLKSVFNMETVNFDKHSSGEFTNRVVDDPNQVSTILTVVQYSFFSLLTDLFILGYVIYLNYILGIIYIVTFLIIYLYERTMLKKIKELSKQRREKSDKILSLFNEVIRGIRDIKLLNINRRIDSIMMKNLDEGTKLSGKTDIKRNTFYDTLGLFNSIQGMIIVLVGIYLVYKHNLTITNLVIIFMYRSNIQDLSLCYRSIKEQWNEYSIACKRIFEFMDSNKYPKEEFGYNELTNVKGKITINNLSFSYDKKRVLNNLSLVIKPNDTIGIVGESGSGKTTLLNLLSKCYPVVDNTIFIDGNDINTLTRNSIRDNISVISQNPYIFNMTIKENLELIGDNITKKDMVEACKIAQIHDYIMTLPDKYNTLLGEGGTTLSGGQRQRLAIARALLKKSKIILFDEATSALDNVTQNELRKSINNISADYTIIIVAHRLSTIRDCNKIYVLDEGKIVGAGTHTTLLKKNKQYKKLYKEETS